MSQSEAIPNVVYKQEFFLPHYEDEKRQDRRNYISSNKYSDYLKYVATGIRDLEKLDFVEYSNNHEKSTGIFSVNGIMNKEQIAEFRKNLRETESVIWSGIISFEEKFGKKWCATYEQAYELVKSELPKYLKNAGLNPDNISWFAGLHENTDNRHIHLVFFEKEPQRMRNKERHFSRGFISEDKMTYFKSNLELSATDFKARERQIRLRLTKSFNERLSDVSRLKLKQMLLSLAEQLPKQGHTYYDCDNMQHLKPQVDNITNYIITHNGNIEMYKLDFDDLIEEKQKVVDSYCKRNDVDKPQQNLHEKYSKDIFRRLGNRVIESAKTLKSQEDERLKLNAKYVVQKRMQKDKLWKELEHCMYLNSKCEYEAIKCFQDYMKKLEERRIKTLIDEGYLSSDLEL